MNSKGQPMNKSLDFTPFLGSFYVLFSTEILHHISKNPNLWPILFQILFILNILGHFDAQFYPNYVIFGPRTFLSVFSISFGAFLVPFVPFWCLLCLLGAF